MEFSFIPLQTLHFGQRLEPHAFKPLASSTSASVEIRPLGGVLEKLWTQNLESKNQHQLANGGVQVSVSHCVPSTHPGIIKVKCGVSEDNPFSRLEAACGGITDRLSVDLEMELGTKVGMQKVEARNVPITKFMEADGEEIGFEAPFIFSKSLQQEWKKATRFVGTIFVTVRVACDEYTEKAKSDRLSDLQRINRKLLEDGTTSDAVIVAENGAEFKCHKFFLSEQSPVFRAMFASDLKEGISGVVKLEDMSEHGVRALLNFLYCREISEEAEKCCSVCLELLLAADKYDIPKLGENVPEVILRKQYTWFTYPVALQLWQLARCKVDEEECYKKIISKCADVLKLKSAAELQACPEFKELLIKNPSAAMELCMNIMK